MNRFLTLSLALLITSVCFAQQATNEFKYITVINRDPSGGLIDQNYTESLKGGILFQTTTWDQTYPSGQITTSLSNFDTSYVKNASNKGYSQFTVPYGFYKLHVEGPNLQPYDTTVNVDCGLKTYLRIKLNSTRPRQLKVYSTFEIAQGDIDLIHLIDQQKGKTSMTNWKGKARWEAINQ